MKNYLQGKKKENKINIDINKLLFFFNKIKLL